MSRCGRPSLVIEGVACAILIAVFVAELALIRREKILGEGCNDAIRSAEARLRAMGPLTASQDDLDACEKDFLEKLHARPSAGNLTLAGKARATLELSRTLTALGMEETDAANAAALLAASPAATLVTVDIAKIEGVRLRAVTRSDADEEAGTHLIIDATCPGAQLTDLLSIIAGSDTGIALDALDLRTSDADNVDIRLQLLAPTVKEAHT